MYVKFTAYLSILAPTLIYRQAKFQTSVNNVKSKNSDIFGIIGVISLAISAF